MIERRQRIPAEEVIEPKRWNLPYWVEPVVRKWFKKGPDNEQ